MGRTLGWADGLGWLAFAATTLLALGGAAALPVGLALGRPGFDAVLALSLATLGLAGLLRPGEPRLLLGLVAAPVLLLAAAFVPPLRPLSGPPLLAVSLGGLVLVIWGAGRVPPGRLLLPVLLALYCGAAARVQEQVGPEGDEPHYLMVAESLWRDGDLSLERDYLERRYAAFYRKPDLEPHFRVRGRGGEIYSLHAVGLSLLILPAYALAGYAGVSFFMACLLALLVRELRECLRAAGENDNLAEGVAWVAGLSPPLVHYAGLVFTEVPAALVVVMVLRRGLEARQLNGGRAALVGLAMAVLPWLNVRYALLAVVLAVYVLLARPSSRSTVALLLPGALSGLCSAGYHWLLYGFLDPRLVYGRRPEFSLATVKEGLPGLLLDQEFGLLVYAPVLVLGVPGIFALARRRARLAGTSAALIVSVLLVSATWHMWRGGFNPPARFLVPVVPAVWLGVASWLTRGPKAAHALLLGWGLWTGLLGASEPRLVHRDRDGTAPFFRTEAGAEEWTRLLPGYVLENADRNRLAFIWAGLLALAAVGAKRSRTAPRPEALAVSIAVLAAAVAAASTLAVARTGGRDAVRLTGGTALELPQARWRERAVARWTPAVLSWGPLYEPHRHPGGAEIGSRLPLEPGRYEVHLRGRKVPGAVAPPELLAVTEPRQGPPEAPLALELRATEEGWRAGFDVPARSRATGLRLRGGSPFLLDEVALARR